MATHQAPIARITKRDVRFDVVLDGSFRDHWWIHDYPRWEHQTFQVFDKYLDPSKTMIDLGTWIGPTVLFTAQKSLHVVGVEADCDAAQTLRQNLRLNSITNVTVIEKAIGAHDGKAFFGPNRFRESAGLNASMSQLQPDPKSNRLNYQVDVISFQTLLGSCVLDESKISLIKVDIEGGEETILRDLLVFCQRTLTPAYVSFHLHWWQDQNLSRFNDLFSLFGTDAQRLARSPFGAFVFDPKIRHVARGHLALTGSEKQ